MIFVVRTPNGRIESITLPFAGWSDVENLRAYYRSRNLTVVEVRDYNVSI